MSVVDEADVPAGDVSARRSWPAPSLAIAVAAVAVSPIVIAACALVGDAWFPVGDMAHQVFRVSQVGTLDTPLIGAETIKGFAHPGPLEFWLAAPLYRMTGEDPRALSWTAAAINVVAVGGIAAVGWRRGRWPLLIAGTALAATLVATLGPPVTVSLWNPFVPLFTFLLCLFLAWDVGLGNRKALLPLAVAASFAAQTHLAFAVLLGIVAVWLAAWARWWPRLLPGTAGATAGDGPDPAMRDGDPIADRTTSDSAASDDGPTAPDGVDALPGPPWAPWRGRLRRVGLVVAVLWLPPVLDLLVDMHNPLRIVASIVRTGDSVGPIDAVGLVGRYVRPDGPWIGGAEPQVLFAVQGSGPLPLLLALAVLVGCVQVGRRRGLADVVALATLALTMTIGAVPATSQIPDPAYPYLTQFLKLIGGVVWLTVAWTGWRLIEPWVRAGGGRRLAAGALGAVTVVSAATWSWGDATAVDTRDPLEEAAVQDLRGQLAETLPREGPVRVEYRGDPLNLPGPGVIYWLIHDGYDVLTGDGAHGLKWGHEHHWDGEEPYDRLVTVAVHYPASPENAIETCASDPSARLLAEHDSLDPTARAWLEDFRLRRLGGPDAVSPEEARRAEQLDSRALQVAVFAGPEVCAEEPDD